MESPVKKLNFDVGKENMPYTADASIPEVVETKKPVVDDVKTEQAVVVASGLRPEEEDEPLLRENKNRFVLFPIKYQEVSRDPTTRRRVECLDFG